MVVRGSSKEVGTISLKQSQSKTVSKQQQLLLKEEKQEEDQSHQKKYILQPKDSLNQKYTTLKLQHEVELERDSSIASLNVLNHDAEITVELQRVKSVQKTEISMTLRDTGTQQASSLIKNQKPQKSIVNLKAEEVIKEAAEPAKHRAQVLSQMTKKTMTRRSNLRHALADEKQKKLL